MTKHSPHHGAKQLALRTVTAVVSTLVLAVSGLVAALGLPASVVSALQGPVATPPSIDVLAAEPDRVLVCMGPALSFGSEGSVAVGYGSPDETTVGSAVRSDVIADTVVVDGFSLEPVATPSPPVVLSQPVDAGVFAATSIQVLGNLNVTGLAASECQKPETEVWLVGGDTTTGRQTAISLVNPSDVQALVDVDVWGSQGSIGAPLGKGILLPPGSQRVLSLAGLAPGEASPVVRVTSQSVGIVASLHSSIVRGLQADGVSVSGSQPVPSTVRVLTGVYTPPEELIGPIKGKEGYRDVGAIVRLLAPADDASVQITVKAPGANDSIIQTDLLAGQTSDLLLDEFNTGDISVIAEADVPIVAGLRTSVGTGAQTDSGWVGSAYEIESETGFAAPGTGESKISFVNRQQQTVVVTLDGRDISVPAGALVTRPIAPGAHTVSASQPVFAAVSIRGETIIEGVMVLPAPAPQGSLLISVR